jgi:hypothetical protein
VPPAVTAPLEQVQIDHTVIDLIIVDERDRQPMGRPYLTIAIDVFTRCVLGMVVALDAPSAVSVGLCLAHVACDKRPWLEGLDVEMDWPMSGKPMLLYLDNAAEFKSEALLENRFEPMMLPLWEANDDCCSLLASFAASLPLRRAGHGPLPARPQRGHPWGAGAPVDGGCRRRRGKRRGGDQPPHAQHGRLHRPQRATAAVRARTDVKPAQRWPLHPAPKEGEALSSWLHRIAACYRVDVREWLERDLGHGQVDDLDTAPPMPLLIALSQRSGIGLDRLRCMSFAGGVPWLLDSLDDRIPDALETYAFQFSVLLLKHIRKTRSITIWRAWLPTQPIHRACPLCLNDPADQAVLLAWKLPLILSCPLHGCWLEAYRGVLGCFLGWENADAAPRTASDVIVAVDQRTWQALTTGYVYLPRQRIHAGFWFRLLRTLLDELNTRLSRVGRTAGWSVMPGNRAAILRVPDKARGVPMKS